MERPYLDAWQRYLSENRLQLNEDLYKPINLGLNGKTAKLYWDPGQTAYATTATIETTDQFNVAAFGTSAEAAQSMAQIAPSILIMTNIGAIQWSADHPFLYVKRTGGTDRYYNTALLTTIKQKMKPQIDKWKAAKAGTGAGKTDF